jgi:hypothetical protein
MTIDTVDHLLKFSSIGELHLKTDGVLALESINQVMKRRFSARFNTIARIQLVLEDHERVVNKEGLRPMVKSMGSRRWYNTGIRLEQKIARKRAALFLDMGLSVIGLYIFKGFDQDADLSQYFSLEHIEHPIFMYLLGHDNWK